MNMSRSKLAPNPAVSSAIIVCLLAAIHPLWAGTQKANQCKQQCITQNEWGHKQILLKEAGDRAVADPECACVKPGTEVTWTNADQKPWTVDFDTLQSTPFAGSRHLHYKTEADKDDRRTIRGGGAIKVYHYKATINGKPADPHVVVGPSH